MFAAGRFEVKHYTPSRVLLLAALLRAQYIPICCLPPEILARIFSVHSSPTFKTPFPTRPLLIRVGRRSGSPGKRPAFDDARVCGKWHHIVVDGPT
ncbi:hypothetical protein C8J57DRAFT_1334017 [Mycena rebaudengoi]|nr:hypothetical protein C8J57DRAFT_1334017 [Mycena rebaudengoi]